MDTATKRKKKREPPVKPFGIGFGISVAFRRKIVQNGEEAQSCPRNRVKFLCSYGGKVLPRPSDCQLKYVGGETRVVAVPRSITFSELMRKLTRLFEVDVVLKYQLMPEDLDALITVTCDEDLNHMLDEYDRHNTKSLANGASPACPDVVSAPAPPPLSFVEPKPLGQRYVDAVNSVFRASTSMFNISSSDSPPMSINETGLPYCNGVREPSEQLNRLGSNGGGMPRVRSSPSLFNLGNHQNHLHHYHLHPQRLARLAPAPVLTGTCKVPQHSSQNRYFRQNWAHQDGSGENGRIHYSGGMEWLPHHLQSPKYPGNLRPGHPYLGFGTLSLVNY